MALNPPSEGLNYVPAYEIPGLPYVTSSTATGIVRHHFPYVAMGFTVKNNSTGTIAIAFTRNGFASSNYLTLLATESFNAETRIRTLFISGSAGAEYSLFATLTTIASRMMPTLTGSTSASNGSVYWEGIG